MIVHDERKPSTFKLLIRSCGAGNESWYYDEIGKYFEFLGEEGNGYKTRNYSGKFVFVKREDGELVKI